MMTLSDNALDGRVGETESFDFLNTYTGGLRYIFKSPFTAVQVIAVDGPSSLETGESGTFTATVNEDAATKPLEYQWEFGDGSTGTGLLATHGYDSPGTYTATFTASNSGSTDSRSLTVEVQRPPQPAELISLNATPNPVEAGRQVSFSSNVRGSTPLTYAWEFGDGDTGSGRSPSHTYDEPGTYTVELTVSNEVEGETVTDSRSLTVTVEPAPPAVCRDVTEFNPVYFARNSSTLSAEGRSALDENIEILDQCEGFVNVRVEGFAAPTERNPEELSTDRARAVSTYYQEQGVAEGRISTRGMGAVGGQQTTKRGGGREFRRADSIPVRQ
jgi:outer membrane protein OmpA-like peptidoglycan-associated protein